MHPALLPPTDNTRHVVLNPLTHFVLRSCQSTTIANEKLEDIDEVLPPIELDLEFGCVLLGVPV